MSGINPGVRCLVGWLNANGFETTDSGDGVTNLAAGMEGALDYPHVFIKGHPDTLLREARRLAVELHIRFGVKLRPQGADPKIPAIQATYDPVDESSVIALTGVDDRTFEGAK